MLHKMDIHDCLIFLEKQGVTDAEIIDRMELNRSTVQRWWKTNKPSPKYLAKMQKWCGEFIPIEDHFYGKKPPEAIFHEALANAYYTLREEGVSLDELRPYAILLRCMEYPKFYDRGIPPATSRGRANRLRTMSGDRPPSIEKIQQIIADYHPEKRISDYFTKLVKEVRLIPYTRVSKESQSIERQYAAGVRLIQQYKDGEEE